MARQAAAWLAVGVTALPFCAVAAAVGSDASCGAVDGGACNGLFAGDDDTSLLALRAAATRVSADAETAASATERSVASDAGFVQLTSDLGGMQAEEAVAYVKDRLPDVGRRMLGAYKQRGVALPSPQPAPDEWKLDCANGVGAQERWTNFQSTFTCDTPAALFCPADVKSLQEIIKEHDDVRASGLGHSWTPFVCASKRARSRALVSTKQLAHIGEVSGHGTHRSIKAGAGVRTRDLMDHLEAHGYVLPSVPFWIDQTIGGAVATNTHGSSLVAGETTLSAQVKSLGMVLANGTAVTFTGADELKAVTPSVGKLGIVYEVEMPVVDDYCLRGQNRHWSEEEFIGQFLSNLGVSERRDRETIQPEGTTAWQIFWFPNIRLLTGSQNLISPPGCSPPAEGGGGDHEATSGGSDDWFLKAIMPLIPAIRRAFPQVFELMEVMMIENSMFCSGDCMASQSQVVPPELVSQLEPYDLYDQYEFAVSMQKAEVCWQTLQQDVMATAGAREMFLAAPIMLRFVGGDNKLMSFSNDGIHMLMNINMNVAYRSHELWECEVWEATIRLLEGPTCDARLHLGKTGWEEKTRAEAAAMYPGLLEFENIRDGWDPEGKFSGGSPVFGGPLTANGLKGKCTGSPQCLRSQRQASRCRCTLPLKNAGWFATPCKWVVATQ